MAREDDLPQRDKELASRRDSKFARELVDTFNKIRSGFEEQASRADDIEDYWDIYNCILGGRQVYNGNAEIYVPIVRLAVNARCTRFLNQLFPNSGRNIDVTTHDEAGDLPRQMLALLENYVTQTRLKTQVIAALLRNGDIEGHYNLFVDWWRGERHVVSRETTKPKIEISGIGPVELGGDLDMDSVVNIREETIADSMPLLDVIHDNDVLIRPTSAASIDDALRQGGDVTLIRRWTKETLKEMIARGEVMAGPAKQLLEMSTREDIVKQVDKKLQDAAGIRAKGTVFQSYETYKVLDTDEGKRLCSSLYGGYDLILSSKRIKFWNDRCPLLSWPHAKIAGSFKGRSSIKAVDTLQYQANDIANQGADSATYSMLPIIKADPAKVRTSTLTLNLAAIWECEPNSVQFAEFPKLWQDAIPQIQAYTQLIFQELSISPAMMPQSTGRPGAKRNQAEIALEQQVDLLTTAEEAEAVEENGLSPMLALWVDYDHQFREEDALVRAYGKLGELASMQTVPPQQNGNRLVFRWSGVEQARNASQMQQQIAFINILRGVEPILQKAGYQLNLAPPLVHAAGNIFGWNESSQIVVDIRQQSALKPELENEIMNQGMPVPVHPLDNGPKHLESHMMSIQAEGDMNGIKAAHVQDHMRQMQMQAMASALKSMIPQGQPGGGPGGGSPPGARGPAPGGQPAGPKLVRGPAGMIHPDAMPAAGAVMAPRKM